MDLTPSSPCLVASSSSSSPPSIFTNSHRFASACSPSARASTPNLHVASADVMSALATRRASLTPSASTSRRSSWVDLPATSLPSSRRASRVDLSNIAAALEPQPQESASTMSSSDSHTTPLPESQGLKRKYGSDIDHDLLRRTSAAEIQLPSDPARRASIINLATAAAAAVLQSQVAQRRMSTRPDQEQKRQRVEQLGLLVEQARMASVGSASVETARQVESATQNVAIATVLATTLGLTPRGTPSAGTPVPSSPKKQNAKAQAATTPARTPTPFVRTDSESLSTEQNSDEEISAPPSTIPGSTTTELLTATSEASTSTPSASGTPMAVQGQSTAASSLGLPTTKLSSKHAEEWESTVTSDRFLDEAKEVANHYSRFYRFEKEWAQKALELEHRRNSVRIDPLHNPCPGPASSDALASVASDPLNASRASSPTHQHSAPESRVMSRGVSPLGDRSVTSSARVAGSTPSTGPSASASSHATPRGSGSGLASVISNFAELIEQRQRSCSGLEALAKQAKELPFKRLSQPNPHFRTTFGEFSWVKQSPQPSTAGSDVKKEGSTIDENDGDSDVSDASEDESARNEDDKIASASSKSVKVKLERDASPETPATPRSMMSIANMI